MSATPPMQSDPSRRRPTLDHLSAATVLALIWVFISLLPLPPNDLWWHMAAGRTMVQEGAWLTTNRWAYTLPADAPYIYQSWLSEILMYGAWRAAGIPGLALLRTLAIALSHLLVAWSCWRRTGGNGKAVALALFAAMLVEWDNWTLRPQTLALVPGAALMALLGECLDGRLGRRWLLAVPAVVALWVNMHGSFVLGLTLVGLAWLAAALRALRRRPRLAGGPSLVDLSLAAAGAVLAACLNPLGPGIFGYVRGMLTNADLQQRFVEWQPPRNNLDPLSAGFWFFVLLLLLAGLMATGPRRPSTAGVLWFCALAWLGIDGARYVIWFALAAAPLLAEQIAARLPARAPALPRALAIGYAASLAALAVATLPWLEPGRAISLGRELKIVAASGPYRTLLSSSTPVGAAEWLADHPIPGRFWTDMSYTSYTIWRLPDVQVFADLRVELFPRAVWDEYFAIAAGDEGSLAAIDRWGITHLMLDRGYQERLIALLQRAPGWCERYQDRTTVVYARCP